MLTTKRVITDDDRQGGYTTTVNRAAPVFNFDNRTPRADVSEYSEYEAERLEVMRNRAAAAEPRTEVFTDRTARRYPAPRRTYSEEDLMPSIQTMQTVRTGRQGRAPAAKRIERTAAVGDRTEKRALSYNAKLLIAVYAIIVFIALVLIIASAVASNKEADRLRDLERQGAALGVEVALQNETIAYYIPDPTEGEYVPAADGGVISIPVKPLGEKTEYKKQSNLFDIICDFFSRLAGG